MHAPLVLNPTTRQPLKEGSARPPPPALSRRRQDDQLDDLSTHVVRIGELGREMGQELQLQGALLDELDQEVEGTSTRLQAAQKKVEFVLKKAGAKGQLLIIGFLIVVLVVLVFLLLA